MCVKYRDDIGVDHIMWECDYPHADTTWPDSQAIALDTLKVGGVNDEEADLITHGNAERVFNWKMAVPTGAGPIAAVDARSDPVTAAATRWRRGCWSRRRGLRHHSGLSVDLPPGSAADAPRRPTGAPRAPSP